MSLIPEISDPFVGAFVGGLLYGLVFCTSACLPYVTGYSAGIGAGFRKGVAVTLIYNLGRIAAYALIGGLIGFFSGLFRFFVPESMISPFQIYSSLAFGIVSIVIGISILLKSKSSLSGCKQDNKSLTIQGKSHRFDYKAFLLGLSRGLVVCPPLIALLIYSIPFANPIGSLGIAVLFGLGTALSPLLLLGGVTGWLLNKAPLFRKWISIAGAAILIVLGIGAMANSAWQLS
jgi:sulfite exporter TauE/SafE